MNFDESEKKQLTVAVVATLVACVSSWMFFAAPASTRASALQIQVDTAQAKLADTQKKANSLPRLEQDLKDLEARLTQVSGRLIHGDQYLWVIQNFGKYQVPDGLEFTGFDQPLESAWGLPGADRLRAANFLVKGVGSYQELGKFTAALENDFPGLRFRSITISPNEPKSDYKVSFVLDIVGLISPAEPAPAFGTGSLLTQR